MKTRQVWSVTGADIRAKRKELGLPQAELAYRLDVSVIAVRDWEHGRHFPHPIMRPRIMSALGMEGRA